MKTPEGWNELLLQDITAKTISYGIVQAGPHVDDGIPYIKSSDLTPQINLEELQRTSHAIHKKYVRSSVVAGDIVFSLRGDIGAVAIVPTTIKVANLTQGTARIAANESVDTNFLYQLFKSNILKKAVLRVCKGSTFQEISLKDLRKIKVTLPDTVEQNRIAEILGTWDRAIAVTEALIARSEAQKKALMQQLLTGKRRLPGFEGAWKEVRLGDVVDIDWGNTSITKKQYISSGVPAYSAAGNDGFVKLAEHKKQGIVLSAIGARCGRCFLAEGQWTAIKNTIVIFEKSQLSNNLFLYYLINDFRFWPISGGAQPFIGLKNAKRAKLTIPSYTEQKAIGEILENCSKQIQASEAKLQALKTEKDALMQQLLTGKRRVKLLEAAA